jgi:hypothetical protein
LGDIEQGIVTRHPDVRAHDVCVEFKLCSTGVCGGCMRDIERAFRGIPVLSPEIEMVVEPDRTGVIPGVLVTPRAGAVELVVRPLFALNRQVAVDVRPKRRTCDAAIDNASRTRA